MYMKSKVISEINQNSKAEFTEVLKLKRAYQANLM
jgi:hypothetical protein